MFGGGLGVLIVESQALEIRISELPDAASILWCTSVYFGVTYPDMDTRVEKDRGGV